MEQIKITEEIKNTKRQFFEQAGTLIHGALALIAALAWNEAIKTLIDTYFPAGTGVYSRFIYAIFITLLVVIVTTKLIPNRPNGTTSQKD